MVTPGESPQRQEEPETPETSSGIVEEIRHEVEDIRHGIEEVVEEVVEHVPPPVRWTVRKLVLLIVAGLVTLVVVAVLSIILYYARRTELVAEELTLFLNQTLTTRSNVRIEVADVRGNPFRRVRLIRPKVVFKDGGSPLLEAPWIELGYSPISLLRGTKSVDIVVQGPVVRLEREPDGDLRLPTWKTSGKIGKPSKVDVHLVIHDGAVHLPFNEPHVRGMELDALLGTGTQSYAIVRSLTWRDGPYQTRSLELRGKISAGDSVRFAIDRLSTADLALSATGDWKKGEADRRMHVDLERLRWRWLARITKNGSFDVPGEAQAHIDIERTSTWAGRFRSRLDWNDLPVTGTGSFRWDGQLLTVQPLLANTDAGRLDGLARWSNAGWDVGGRVQDGHPDLWKAIGITGWPEGNLQGTFMYRVDTRKHVSNGTLEATLGASVLAGWRADSAYVDAALPAHGVRTFDVRALRRGGAFVLHGATVEGGWRGDYTVEKLPLDEWPDGRASGIKGVLSTGSGTVAATGGALQVTGDLAGESTTWFGMEAARWRLTTVDGALMPKPDLVATAHLANVTFLGLHFDSVASPIHLGDQTLAMIDTRAQAGDTLITFAGRADWNSSTWRVGLDRARAESPHFTWTADPPVRIAGNPQGVTFDRLEARDSSASLTVSGRWAVPGGSYDWTARARSLDLSRLGLPPDWGLVGTTDAELRVDGPSGAPRWSFEGAMSRPGWGGHVGDSLVILASGAAHQVDVRRAEFRLRGGTLETHGRFDGTANAWPDSLTGTSVARWLATASRWAGQASAHDFPIEPMTSMNPATKGWIGELQGTLDVSGSPAQPRLETTSSITPLGWRDFDLDRLDVKARYADDRLVVDDLRATRSTSQSVARGTLPVHLELGHPAQMLDRPMDATIQVDKGDLGILTLLVPQIAQAAGDMTAVVRIGGTGKKPTVEGNARVSRGTLRLTGRDELLEDVRATFHMNQTTVTLDSLVARQGVRGRVNAHGTVQLKDLTPGDYRFDVRMRDFTASEPGLYAIQFDGDFVVTNGSRVRGQAVPYVTGKATVSRAVILIDFANQSENEQLAANATPLYWLYRIDLNAKSNVHWQPPDGDIEFNMDLTAEQTATELRVFGEMHALRGTYYFLSNRFTVQNADLTFDNATGVNPLIDANATTRIIDDAPGTVRAGQSESLDITVHITGRAKEPSIALASSPSRGEDEILKLITVGRFVSPRGVAGVASADPFDNYITRALNRTLSAEMSRAFKGYINEWVLDREQGGLFAGSGDLIVGVGSQVTPNLMLRYRQRVPGLGLNTRTLSTDAMTTFDRDLEAEYRLNRFFLITSEVAQRRNLGGTTATPTTPDFNVNLKARWEY